MRSDLLDILIQRYAQNFSTGSTLLMSHQLTRKILGSYLQNHLFNTFITKY